MKSRIITLILSLLMGVSGIAFPMAIAMSSNRDFIDLDDVPKLKTITSIETTTTNNTTTQLDSSIEETTQCIEETTSQKETTTIASRETTGQKEITTQEDIYCTYSHKWSNTPIKAIPSSEGCIVTYCCIRDNTHTYDKVIAHQWKKSSTNDDGSINYSCSMCGGTYTTEPPAETTSTSSNGKYIGNFKITGYYAGEGQTISASGMSLIPWKTCAMNNSRRKELGLHYGDCIYVDGLGTFTLVDCGCSYNTIDIYVSNKSEAYALTSYKNVYRG